MINRVLSIFGWEDKNLFEKIVFVICLPLIVMRDISTPRVDEWRRKQAALSLCFAPVLCLFVIGGIQCAHLPLRYVQLTSTAFVSEFMLLVGGVVPLAVVIFLIGAGLAVVAYVFWLQEEPPKKGMMVRISLHP